MSAATDDATIRTFVNFLHPDLLAGETIEIRAFGAGGTRHREFFRSPGDAAGHIAALSTDRNIFAGICPRRGRDGTKAGVSRVRRLWADLDWKHFHSPEDARATLAAFPLPPSLLVATGGGLHAYWSLAGPLDAATHGPRVEALLRRLYAHLGIDAVQDLSRVFRVPGTLNNKPEYGKPRPVTIERHEPGHTYTIEQFEAVLPAPDPPTRPPARPVWAGGRPMPGDDERPTLDELRDLLAHIDPCLPYTEYIAVWGAVALYYPGADGLQLVDEWSSEAREANGQYSSPRTQPEKHRGFRRTTDDNVTTLGTLIWYARQRGYVTPSSADSTFTPRSHTPMTDPDAPWSPPVPLAARALPPFPLEALPPALRDFAAAEAVATQTPPELAAFFALAAAAAAVARKAEIGVMRGWREPLNVFLAVVLPSGNRKSAVERAAVAPLRAWERAAVERGQPDLAAARSRRKIAEGKLKKAERDAAEGKEQADREQAAQEAERLARELAATPEPVPLQLLADDATPETVKTLLAEQGGRLALLSAEGTVFEQMGGRYARNGASNLEAYLQGHAGDEIRVNRRGRTELVRDPALTIGLAVQPDVLRAFADRPEFRGRGLVARFLYALPASLVGRRVTDPPPVPDEVAAAYAATIARLLDLPLPATPHTLVLDAHAARRFRAFRETHEPHLAEFGRLGAMADWGSKLPGAVARVAGLLHLAAHAGHPRPWEEPIGLGTIEGAIAIGEYAIPHALAAANLMGQDDAEAGAASVLRWLATRAEATLPEQSIWQGTKGRFAKAEALHDALAVLTDHEYIRAIPAVRKGTGRPSRPDYAINPLWSPRTPTTPRTSAGGGDDGTSRGSRGSRIGRDGDAHEPPAAPTTTGDTLAPDPPHLADDDAEIGEV